MYSDGPAGCGHHRVMMSLPDAAINATAPQEAEVGLKRTHRLLEDPGRPDTAYSSLMWTGSGRCAL